MLKTKPTAPSTILEIISTKIKVRFDYYFSLTRQQEYLLSLNLNLLGLQNAFNVRVCPWHALHLEVCVHITFLRFLERGFKWKSLASLLFLLLKFNFLLCIVEPSLRPLISAAHTALRWQTTCHFGQFWGESALPLVQLGQMLFSFHPPPLFALLIVIVVQVCVHIFHLSCHLLAVLVNHWFKAFGFTISHWLLLEFRRLLPKFDLG